MTNRETAGRADSCPRASAGRQTSVRMGHADPAPVGVHMSQTPQGKQAGRNMKSSGRRGQERRVYSREKKLE